ncbi:MAG: hypothetical protein MUE90_05325 [Thermoanaerobaculales bacterium]|nr:hypothetical protein [Thermoanaerobaculales bacterium]
MASARDDWRPTGSLEALRRRAEMLATVRSFFAARDVLEVETPLLAAAPVTDLHLHALSCRYRGPGADEGRRHNPEFTILEWYRPGWDHRRLMEEIDELLAVVLGTGPGERLSYAEAFLRHAGLDPHAEPEGRLRERVAALGVPSVAELGRDDLLDLLLSHLVEPRLGHCQPSFVVDYPASQAALARVRPGSPPLAERFEVFVEGLELANGYHELVDAAAQRRRFEADLEARRREGLPAVPIDERLLAALEHGLPACAGVALGLDRLLMLALGSRDIAEVVAFPIGRA